MFEARPSSTAALHHPSHAPSARGYDVSEDGDSERRSERNSQRDLQWDSQHVSQPAPQPASQPASQREPQPEISPTSAESLYLHLLVSDAETIEMLGDAREGRDRQEFALTALKVGCLALRAARGTVDSARVRDEGDRLLATMGERLENHRQLLDQTLGATLKTYFDPGNGAFTDRLTRLLRHDGELATVVQNQVHNARESLDTLLQSHLGEASPIRSLLSSDAGNAFIATLRGQVTESLQTQEQQILAEFSLDRPDSALRRLVEELRSRHGDLERSIALKVSTVVDEFSLDKEDSALSRLVGRVDVASGQISAQFSLDNPASGLNRMMQQLDQYHQAQSANAQAFEGKVMTLLERLATRKAESKLSTVHGAEFEQRVGEQLRVLCSSGAELVDEVGATQGAVPKCKVGDFVITLGPDSAAAGASIVIEAKERAGLSLRATLDEADIARRNRRAAVCLFVHSTATAGPDIPELQRWGNDVIVKWNAENPDTDVVLRAGLMVAKALSIRSMQHADEDAASFSEIDASIEAIRKQLQGLDEISTMALTIVNNGEKIRSRARIIGNEVERRVTTLGAQTDRLRKSAVAAGGAEPA